MPREAVTASDRLLDEAEKGSKRSMAIWNRALQELNPESLSPRSRAIRLVITDEMQDEMKEKEISEAIGQPWTWVKERLNELRSEVALNTGHFMPLTHTEFAALMESVEAHGVQTPIIIGEHQLIDGRHRWLVSEALGLKDIPAVFVQGLSAEEERQIAVTVNMARRHLNRAQKRFVIRNELQRDWSRSSRQIAMICGVSAPTVEEVRFEMRLESEYVKDPTAFVPPKREDEKRVDASGRTQKAYVSGRNKPETEKKEIKVGYATCSHGEAHTIYQNSDGTYSLRSERD